MDVVYRRKIGWAELEALQSELRQRVVENGAKRFLLVSEPTPTFTHGLSGKPAGLLWNNAEERGVAVFAADRGGQWTYHGPGQIVVYPIGRLEAFGFGRRQVRAYVENLASSVQNYLRSLGIASTLRDCPYGVFTARGKIASFGIGLRGGITSHGLALYLTPQAAYFEGIVPCGRAETAFSSIAEEGAGPSWEEAARGLAQCIETGFQDPKS